VIEHLFMHMFNGLATKYAAELEAVQAQFPFEPIQAKPLRLTFAGADLQPCMALDACWRMPQRGVCNQVHQACLWRACVCLQAPGAWMPATVLVSSMTSV
jgi:hypothetical protein